MPLQFYPPAHAYDASCDAVSFRAFDGARPVMCRVPRQVLRELAGGGLPTANEALHLYEKTAGHIHRAAAAKYRRGEFGPDGTVLLGSGDLGVTS